MIVINGCIPDEIKQHLLKGGSHPPQRRHGNVIVAGGNCFVPTGVAVKKVVFTATGDESWTFQTANNTLYHKFSEYVNVPHSDLVYAVCTHFSWGKGAIIGDMNDKEFILNYTASTGNGTGNVSFQDRNLFTSAAVAKAWFKEQYENGTPVTVVAYFKA